MTSERLQCLLDQIAGLRLLVVGDAMVDEYIWGEANRVSPEAPVLVVESRRVTQVPGGAANVVHNMRELGAAAGLCAVIGNDLQGSRLAEQMVTMGADPVRLAVDPGRPTTVKTRVVAGPQQVVRIDLESTDPLAPALVEQFLADATEAMAGCVGVLFSDYDKGVLTGATIAPLRAHAASLGLLTAVNAKPHQASDYTEFGLFTVNRFEASAIIERSVETVGDGCLAAQRIGQQLGCGLVLVTLGGDGAVLWSGHGEPVHVPARKVQVYDPAGAGDTTITTCHLALCAGADPVEAVELATLAAAVVVRKVGVATASPEEIRALA